MSFSERERRTVSRLMNPPTRDDGCYQVGDRVEFDGPQGDRLMGEVVHASIGRQTYYNVAVGERACYEVRPGEDHMRRVQ